MLDSALGLVTLFFIDKPNQVLKLYQHIKKRPAQFGLGPFYFVQALGEKTARFRWPRCAWEDFPLILEPVLAPLSVVPMAADGPAHLLITCYDNGILQFVADDTVRKAAKQCKELRVICACNLDDRGAWAFARASQELLGFEGFPITPDLRLMNLSEKGIAQAFELMGEGVTTAGRQPLYEGKQLHRHFEYNWWLNAHTLLRPALARCDLRDDLAISKFEMQFLYVMRELPRLPEPECLHLMGNWKGTGKHPVMHFGSPKTWAMSLQRLLFMGALNKVNGDVGLSPAGEFFLDFLPKSCEDVDLPMRLAVWRGLPKASHQTVDAYLLEWFGKLKKRLEK